MKSLAKKPEAPKRMPRRLSRRPTSRELIAHHCALVKQFSKISAPPKKVPIAEEEFKWTPPKAHPWPKTHEWSNDEIVEATLGFEQLVAEVGRAEMPSFSAVELLRESEPKYYKG